MGGTSDDMNRILLASFREVERVAPGISLTQLTMLLHIILSEGIRVSELARACGTTDATTSRAVRAMLGAGEGAVLGAGHGLVEQLRGPDGRARHLAPTERGLALVADLVSILTGMSASLPVHVTAPDQACLMPRPQPENHQAASWANTVPAPARGASTVDVGRRSGH